MASIRSRRALTKSIFPGCIFLDNLLRRGAQVLESHLFRGARLVHAKLENHILEHFSSDFHLGGQHPLLGVLRHGAIVHIARLAAAKTLPRLHLFPLFLNDSG